MTDPWTAIQRLIGQWEGTASGEPGTGHQIRRYEPILRGKFIMGTDTTRWQPTDSDPDGEIHEDLSVIGFDKAKAQLVMRSFFVEGFACEYRCVEASEDGNRFVFEAKHIENGPPGLRARETLVFTTDDALESRFDLATGAEFTLYTAEHLLRIGEGRG